MYAWATPDYLLDNLSFQQIMMYYNYGMEFEENKSNILVNRLAVGFFGVEEPEKKDYNDTPDKKKFYKHYGDKIKRPESGVKG
jgi:hypothetical protein